MFWSWSLRPQSAQPHMGKQCFKDHLKGEYRICPPSNWTSPLRIDVIDLNVHVMVDKVKPHCAALIPNALCRYLQSLNAINSTMCLVQGCSTSDILRPRNFSGSLSGTSCPIQSIRKSTIFTCYVFRCFFEILLVRHWAKSNFFTDSLFTAWPYCCITQASWHVDVRSMRQSHCDY